MTPDVVTIELLGGDAWERLRAVRLAALQEAPRAFLATNEEQVGWPPEQWHDEVRRGRWLVAVEQCRDVGLIGATPEPDIPPSDRYLSYMWVKAALRGQGLGSRLVTTLLEQLRSDRVPRVWLWVLGDNAGARTLYERLGFRATGDQQPLKKNPARRELRMMRGL